MASNPNPYTNQPKKKKKKKKKKIAMVHGPPRRVGLSVEVISEGETRMGALVKFTDLESRERISTQLQVSERMAQPGPHHRGRGARSEKSAELDAHLAGKSESQFAGGRRHAAAGGARSGQ